MRPRAYTQTRETIKKNYHNGMLDFFNAFDGGPVYYTKSKNTETMSYARKMRLNKIRKAQDQRRAWIIQVLSYTRSIPIDQYMLLNPKGRRYFKRVFNPTLTDGEVQVDNQALRTLVTEMRLCNLEQFIECFSHMQPILNLDYYWTRKNERLVIPKGFKKHNFLCPKEETLWVSHLMKLLNSSDTLYADVVPIVKVLNEYVSSPIRMPKILGTPRLTDEKRREILTQVLTIDPRDYWLIDFE